MDNHMKKIEATLNEMLTTWRAISIELRDVKQRVTVIESQLENVTDEHDHHHHGVSNEQCDTLLQEIRDLQAEFVSKPVDFRLTDSPAPVQGDQPPMTPPFLDDYDARASIITVIGANARKRRRDSDDDDF